MLGRGNFEVLKWVTLILLCLCTLNEIAWTSWGEIRTLVGWVTIELTEGARMISPCMGGTFITWFDCSSRWEL
jgi:hypothetical protein